MMAAGAAFYLPTRTSQLLQQKQLISRTQILIFILRRAIIKQQAIVVAYHFHNKILRKTVAKASFEDFGDFFHREPACCRGSPAVSATNRGCVTHTQPAAGHRRPVPPARRGVRPRARRRRCPPPNSRRRCRRRRRRRHHYQRHNPQQQLHLQLFLRVTLIVAPRNGLAPLQSGLLSSFASQHKHTRKSVCRIPKKAQSQLDHQREQQQHRIKSVRLRPTNVFCHLENEQDFKVTDIRRCRRHRRCFCCTSRTERDARPPGAFFNSQSYNVTCRRVHQSFAKLSSSHKLICQSTNPLLNRIPVFPARAAKTRCRDFTVHYKLGIQDSILKNTATIDCGLKPVQQLIPSRYTNYSPVSITSASFYNGKNISVHSERFKIRVTKQNNILLRSTSDHLPAVSQQQQQQTQQQQLPEIYGAHLKQLRHYQACQQQQQKQKHHSSFQSQALERVCEASTIYRSSENQRKPTEVQLTSTVKDCSSAQITSNRGAQYIIRSKLAIETQLPTQEGQFEIDLLPYAQLSHPAKIKGKVQISTYKIPSSQYSEINVN